MHATTTDLSDALALFLNSRELAEHDRLADLHAFGFATPVENARRLVLVAKAAERQRAYR